MSKLQLLEWALVLGILVAQFRVFFKTRNRISLFESIFPRLKSLQILPISIPFEDLKTFPPKEILKTISQYLTPSPEADQPKINVIHCAEKENDIFKKIRYSLNTYLIRNREVATDFNLVKDIVERNVDAVEEDINLTMAIPLYLGLMGTMIGIVIGLLNVSLLSPSFIREVANDQLGGGIPALLGSVWIAMIASLTGLGLTVLNSGWYFKGSKNRVEEKKNEFYTFIQTELLPIINQSVAATFESLQRNLLKFNTGLTETVQKNLVEVQQNLLQFNTELKNNLSNLSGIFDKSTQNLKLQEGILKTIGKIDVAQMVKFNIRVFQELQACTKGLESSTERFHKFNEYLSQVNSFVDNSKYLADRVVELLARSENFKTIADNVDGSLNQGRDLMAFLSQHFENLDNHKKLIEKSLDDNKRQIESAVISVDDSLTQVLTQLKEHTEKSMISVRDFAIEEADAVKQMLSESRMGLGNLQYLEKLNNGVAQIREDAASQGEQIKKGLSDLNQYLVTSIVILQDIRQAIKGRGIRAGVAVLFDSVKCFFLFVVGFFKKALNPNGRNGRTSKARKKASVK
jgi:hypothetical protein